MNIIKIPNNHKMFNMELHAEFDPEQSFIFDEFYVCIMNGNDVTIGLYVFCKNLLDMQILLISINGEVLDKEVWYEVHENENYSDGIEVLCNTTEERCLKIGHKIANLVIKIMLYIMTAPRNKVNKNKTVSVNEFVEEKNKSKKRKSVDREIFLLDDLVQYVSENGLPKQKTGKTIDCPCWGVRGHWRHYKNGKVIFIKNYLKGKNRDTVQPKSKQYTV